MLFEILGAGRPAAGTRDDKAKFRRGDERPIFPGGARAVLLTGKPIYQALGIPDVRHRRSKAATTIVLMRRLLSLDYKHPAVTATDRLHPAGGV